MASGYVIRRNQYFDSVFLMGINNKLSHQPGVQNSAVLMGTEGNKILLREIGITAPELDAATPNDLIVGLVGEDQVAIETIFANLDDWFEGGKDESAGVRPKTLEDGLSARPEANLAVISVPGAYAAREARKALEHGLHVFLFSDNVPVTHEVELKEFAQEKGLLVMGPDCGTSILNGVGIGFANKVRPGNVGVVGASGTGLQEFTSQIHNAGFGISQAIGTGGHDLSDEVGGITTLAALRLLEQDVKTEVIAVVSKPPGAKTMKRILGAIASFKTPVIGCFLGLDEDTILNYPEAQLVRTIDEAVLLALDQSRPASQDALQLAERMGKSLSPSQRYVRGVFAGGTFCYQSQQVFRDAGLRVFSNTPMQKSDRLEDPDASKQHTMVDMGDDRYTVTKPHPMIDGTYRRKRILQECRDPEVAVILLDIVLGFNASPDPVGDILDAVLEAKKVAGQRGDTLVVAASVCGTDQDFQDRNLQVSLLEDAGVMVFDSNAQAASFCAKLVSMSAAGAK